MESGETGGSLLSFVSCGKGTSVLVAGGTSLMGRKSWKQRFFVLSNGCLSYFASEKASFPMLDGCELTIANQAMQDPGAHLAKYKLDDCTIEEHLDGEEFAVRLVFSEGAGLHAGQSPPSTERGTEGLVVTSPSSRIEMAFSICL